MSRPRARVPLFFLAVALGLVIVLGGNAATDLVLGRTPLADGTLGSIDAPDVFFMQMIGTSLPMVVLALRGSRSVSLWAVAVALTIMFSAYATYSIWRSSLTGFAGGADIGLGLILMASPLIILLVLAAIRGLQRASGGSPPGDYKA